MSDFWITVIIISGFWFIISFFDIIFKSCMFQPYFSTLEKIGLHISTGKINYFSSHFNAWFHRISRAYPSFFHIWFSVGSISSVIAILPATVFMAHNVLKNFSSSPDESSLEIMTAVIPGVNLPVSQLLYYVLALLLCSVFHEMGHAVAAYCEGLQINGVGLLLYVIVPTAYVDIPTQQLNRLSFIKQLKIFCAGVWHNFILALASYLLLIAIPILCEPAYAQNSGVYVTYVDQNLPISGRAGINKSDVITSINDCIVENNNDWSNCLIKSLYSEQGYCLLDISVSQADVNIERKSDILSNESCCPQNNPSGLCFYKNFNPKDLACLQVRAILDESRGDCNQSVKCKNSQLTCVIPVLEKNYRLITLHRENKQEVIFYGHPAEVYHGVSVSNYIPRFSIVPALLPIFLENLLNYTISFSAGLGLLNIIPCLFLDGQHILRITINLMSSSFISDKRKLIFAINFIIYCGTFLLFSNVAIAFWKLF